MTEWNTPVDGEHLISAQLMAEVRKDLKALRQLDWEPAPMPEDYHPSPDEHLQPLPYSTPYPALGARWLRPDHRGDEVFFYDYCLRKGRRHSARMYP